ncbi:MAG TPA: hypothetical protein DCY47_10235 [Candidatus Accumulibacter sp.]|nr:hypothetical protein [Accumulibacter sp.]
MLPIVGQTIQRIEENKQSLAICIKSLVSFLQQCIVRFGIGRHPRDTLAPDTSTDLLHRWKRRCKLRLASKHGSPDGTRRKVAYEISQYILAGCVNGGGLRTKTTLDRDVGFDLCFRKGGRQNTSMWFGRERCPPKAFA